MSVLTVFLQLLVAFILLNVWLLRYSKNTPFRGADAPTLKDEFDAYGLPTWFFYLIGVIKVGSAILLILGIWFPVLVLPVGIVLTIMMIGAIAMHIKVADPWMKSIPALMMLVLSVALCFSARYPL